MRSDKNNRMELAAEIGAKRRSLGLSMAGFAARLGVSGAACSYWESGKAIPRPRVLERIRALRKDSAPVVAGPAERVRITFSEDGAATISAVDCHGGKRQTIIDGPVKSLTLDSTGAAVAVERFRQLDIPFDEPEAKPKRVRK